MSGADYIHEAFKQGALETLLMVLDKPPARLNVPYSDAFGHCLEYAIYHSPLSLIRRLLELGADPNYPDHAGFPALIAVLTTARPDRNQIIELLIAGGANIQQRGVTALPPCTWQRRPMTSARRSYSWPTAPTQTLEPTLTTLPPRWKRPNPRVRRRWQKFFEG